MPAGTTNNFRFINSYSSTGLKNSRDTRRDVRSYVARVSHPNTKDRSVRLKDDKHRGTVVFDVEITSLHDDEDGGPPLSAPVPSQKTSAPPNQLPLPPYILPGQYNNVPMMQPQQSSTLVPQQQTVLPKYPPNTLSASPINRLSTYTISPIATLPVYHLPYVPGILANYISKLAVPIPEIDNNSPRPLIRTLWLPMVVQNPAIFHVIVLLAAAYYAVYADPTQYPRMYAEILSLKQKALKGLMMDLQKVQCKDPAPGKSRCSNLGSAAPSRGCGSDGSEVVSLPETETVTAARRISLTNSEEECLIAAIAKMASYEAIFGDTGSYHTHMRAVVGLLKRRAGGLASLSQDGMLSRLLRFIDTNSAFLLGTNLYLCDDDGVGVCLPRHMPLKAKRFSEMEAQGVKPGDIVQERMEHSGAAANAATAGGERRDMIVDRDRFIGLCGTGDAVRY